MSDPRTEPFPDETNLDPTAPNRSNLEALARRLNKRPGENELSPDELRQDHRKGPDRA